MTPEEFGKGLTYINRVLVEFFKEDDRAAATLVAAELDTVLYTLLANYLGPEDQHSSPLLERNGPLESFGARIEIAYRIGLIPPVFHHDLHLIRRIRNIFAHGRAGLSFETPEVMKHADKMILGKQLVEYISTKQKAGSKKISSSARSLFRLSASELLPRIFINSHQAGRIKPIWPTFFTTQEEAEK